MESHGTLKILRISNFYQNYKVRRLFHNFFIDIESLVTPLHYEKMFKIISNKDLIALNNFSEKFNNVSFDVINLKIESSPTFKTNNGKTSGSPTLKPAQMT